MTTSTVTIPNVQLTLDQLVAAIRQLEPEGRAQIAKALTEAELDAQMTRLITELYSKPPVTDISDEDINAEVRAVRQPRRS